VAESTEMDMTFEVLAVLRPEPKTRTTRTPWQCRCRASRWDIYRKPWHHVCI